MSYAFSLPPTKGPIAERRAARAEMTEAIEHVRGKHD